MKNNILTNLVLSLLIIAFMSCEKETDFLTTVNPNQITTQTFFKTVQDATYAVNATYAPLQSGYMYHNSYFTMLDVGIEMSANSNMPATWHISTFSFISSDKTVSQVWKGLYQIVSRANYAIENIEKMENLNATTKNRLLGEAHFLRGWAYFELAFFWGKVPMYISVPKSSDDTNKPRSENELMVYEQAIADFTFAKDNLPVSYSTVDIGRATKGAAIGYLGKINLFMASEGVNLKTTGFKDAEDYFKLLVEPGEFSYDLMADYIDNFTWFKENNKESLFEVQYTNIGGHPGYWDAHDEIAVVEGTNRARTFGYLTWFNAYMNPKFIARFPDEDPRLRFNAYGPPTPAYPNKMKIFNNVEYNRTDWCARKYERYDYIAASAENGDSPINFRVLRFADVLLMYAEALIEQNKVAQAIPYINRVRQRTSVNMPALSLTLSQEEARTALRNERMYELALEQCRMKDAIRWGAQFAENEFDLSGIEAFEFSKHRYLPIPQSEIDYNLAIDNTDQNPGY